MAGFDALSAYRRMFATAEDGLTAWWYFGTSFVEMPGYPTIPVLHIETLMIYRTVTLSPDAFRMEYWEIGYMRDPTTGEIARRWLNPITGAEVTSPDRFEEGPAHFTIERIGSALKLDLVQAHARIESVDVVLSLTNDRVMIEQTERKVRGFPLPDGSMPSLDSDSVSRARTKLTMVSSQADLQLSSAPCSGAYEFELAQPPWMGFGDQVGRSITRGVMVKTDMNEKRNPVAWERMKSLYPDCFDGDEVRPRWAAGGAPLKAVAAAG